MKRPVRKAILARERVLMLPRDPLWEARTVTRTIRGRPGAHYISGPKGTKVAIQWDAHMGTWAETRP